MVATVNTGVHCGSLLDCADATLHCWFPVSIGASLPAKFPNIFTMLLALWPVAVAC